MKITLGDLLEKDIDSAFIKRYKNLGFEEIDWGNVKKIVINDEIIHEFLYDVISKFKISNIELLYDSVCDNLLVLDRWNNNSNLIYDTSGIISDIKTPLLLKMSCFMCEETLKASLIDVIKVGYKFFNKPTNKYSVVYGNGILSKGWL